MGWTDRLVAWQQGPPLKGKFRNGKPTYAIPTTDQFGLPIISRKILNSGWEDLIGTTMMINRSGKDWKEVQSTMAQSLPCSQETELIRLCRAGIWMGVSARVRSHPRETIPADVAARGEGTTALAMAVRLGAPLIIVQQLLDANLSQISINHMVRGTVLHEAFKHRANDATLECLVQATIAYSRQNPKESPILARQDELGRTCLHYLVDRVGRSMDRGQKNGHRIWGTFGTMVQMYPPSVRALDADGNTPLVLLLLIPKMNNSFGEKDIANGLRIMLHLCPKAVQVPRRLPCPWHVEFQPESSPSALYGEGVPSPLSCALLQGRSIESIELLLDASKRVGINSCRAIVTHNREIPLHIAATMRCTPKVLSRLIQEEDSVASVSDIHGLNTLDWVWIRHVIDWCSMSDPFAPVVVSRRRYLNHNFIEWYNKVSNQYLGFDPPLVSGIAKKLRSDIVQRMCILLPRFAGLFLHDEKDEDGIRLPPLVHAVCLVNCPLALVQLACESCPKHLHQRDTKMRRLPLHYALTRRGYLVRYPIGVSCNIQYIEEVSPMKAILLKFPKACRITDKYCQLPLHILIDFSKTHNQTGEDHITLSRESQGGCQEGIELLLGQYPEALQRRDGKTKLYPFLQASEGHNGNVDLTFLLLRRDPSLLSTNGNTTNGY
eukprot:scaffold2816_cov121-Cylindrotheca_fusiformis.AAC.42